MTNIWELMFLGGILLVLYVFVRFYIKNKKTEYEFTSIINHTFRTPLTRINWISKELERIDVSGEEKLLYIQSLKNATDKLLEIVDLIVGSKDIRNIHEYSLQQTSFRNIVEESIKRYREDINKKNIAFKVSLFNDIPLLSLDIKKISFAVDTIVENAIIYTPKDGGIIIDCVLKSNNKLLFYVADTGIGLSFYDKMKIFGKFYRSAKAVSCYPDGMGLRLYLSKQIIKRHNGQIYAKSKGKDKGTVFFIELPINK